MKIDAELVQKLIQSQFPQYMNLEISPVKEMGWDNRTFRLGKMMSVRLPSDAMYAPQIEKEAKWLPKLAPHLPLPIPLPLEIGNPQFDYPWKWSIVKWIEGTPLTDTNLAALARDLALFLQALQSISTEGGPKPGLHSFHRGGNLSIYDSEVKESIKKLGGKIQSQKALDLWNESLASQWSAPLVWVHGDLSAGNLLIKENRLAGVIDFGQLTTGDPACDLSVYWTLFNGKSADIFKELLNLDENTWIRGRGWSLWKALTYAMHVKGPINFEAKRCWLILKKILESHN